MKDCYSIDKKTIKALEKEIQTLEKIIRHKDKMVTRLSFTDFDGKKFLEGINTYNQLEDEVIEKYAPNVVQGIQKLSKWAKNL